MAKPDIPAAKRAGLAVDFDRLAKEGDHWLTPEERYALKTYGVCAQLQDGVFMVRIRVPGGVLPVAQARALARIARAYGPDWLHLTTRQNLELHWVEAERVPLLLTELERTGLSTRSSCGHTLRNVMCSEDAGLDLDEPFDCFADARALSDAIVARSAELNCALPSRVNVVVGGSPRCRADALVNDAGFVSTVRDGAFGYEVWAGGSLGKDPSLSIRLSAFVPRTDLLAAAEALIEVFVEHGDFENPAKGRMKYVVASLGHGVFRDRWLEQFETARRREHPPPPELARPPDADRPAVLRLRPAGGWSRGVRPQRQVGRAMVTIDIPLGDTNGGELELIADLAERFGDGFLVLTRDQNVTLRNVELAAVPLVRDALRRRGVAMLGEGDVASIRACTGSAVCALGITQAPEAGRDLLALPSLARHPELRVHISGCPNSCAQHQAADIGLSGAKVRIGGVTTEGYQVWLGADLGARRVGQMVGRVSATDMPDVIDAVVGTWEALRHEAESIATTVARIGIDSFAAQVTAEAPAQWEPGPDPDPTTSEQSSSPHDHRSVLVPLTRR
jgi:sulfite reductase beta subunit-like hemoprotein